MENYNIGLDIGTNSVGWAVTNDYGKLLKIKNKNAFGSRLFEAGSTAKDRRNYRNSRRRIRRRKYRLGLLEELFSPFILEKDSSFFIRLKNSFLLPEDKNNNKYILFNDENYNDQNFHQEYPTIYHLRKAIIENNNQKFDIRLIYLACHHIIKYRGHFLYNQEFDFKNLQLNQELKTILKNLNITINDVKVKKMENLLLDDQLTKKEKIQNIKDTINKSIPQKEEKILISIIQASLGYKIKLKNLFYNLNPILENETFDIQNSSFDNKYDEWKILISDKECEIIEKIKSINSIVILANIIDINNKAILSAKMVNSYHLHKQQLAELKTLIRQYCPKEYNQFFKDKESNYQLYINGQSLDDFYNNIKKIISNFPEDKKQEILSLMDDKNYLIKQRSFINAAIPYQVQKYELNCILEQQSKFYPELKQIKDKVISLLTYRIPYYIGPLTKNSDQSPYSWIIRKNNQKLTPWNMDDNIDKEKTAENFIMRMTNQDTYLLAEKVLPKQSIIYQFYEVLNELNKIRIEGLYNQEVAVPLSTELKQEIILNVFMKYKSVSISQLNNYLIKQSYTTRNVKIFGLSDHNKFLSSLSSYHDMKKIFGDSFISQKEQLHKVEQVIEYNTIFEDRDILNTKLQKLNLSQKQINQILNLRYQGWGRLSYKLLYQLKQKNNKGQYKSILDLLWETQDNFMQIYYSDTYKFYEKVNELNDECEDSEDDIIKETVKNPALSRSLNQALKIIDEIVEIKGYAPKNIYLEFSRNDGKKVRTTSRDNQLKAKFNQFPKVFPKDMLKELKSDLAQHKKQLDNDRLYLYFLQCGKSLYSGKTLDINNLSQYEIDHIWPQSMTTDNSLDNKALVLKEENQLKSNNYLLNKKTIQNQKEFWTFLNKMGLISNIKLSRLMRSSLSQEQSQQFLNRQIVETSQITKLLANILSKRYSKTKIIGLKASLITQFRKQFNFYKIRNLNNYHHAHDAYLLSIIGEYLQAHTSKEEQDAMEYGKFLYSKNKTSQKSIVQRMKFPLLMKDNHSLSIENIQSVLEYKQCNISYKIEFHTAGKLYNETIQSAEKMRNSKKECIPIKSSKELDPEKYGGYSGETNAFTTLVRIKKGKKMTYQRIGIPTYQLKNIHSKEEFHSYLDTKINTPYEVICYHLGKNQKIKLNGNWYYLSSHQEYTTAFELCLPLKIQGYIYKANQELKETLDITDKTANQLTLAIDMIIQIINQNLSCKCTKEHYKYLNSHFKDDFKKLPNKDKVKVTNELINFCKAKTNRQNVMNKIQSKRHSKQTKMNSHDEVLFQSVTGLKEKRVILS